MRTGGWMAALVGGLAGVLAGTSGCFDPRAVTACATACSSADPCPGAWACNEYGHCEDPAVGACAAVDGPAGVSDAPWDAGRDGPGVDGGSVDGGVDAGRLLFYGEFAARKALTVPPGGVTGTLEAFPMLVRLMADPDLAARARADGTDLHFFDATGVALPWELEAFNPDGSLLAWVLVPSITPVGGATIHLAFGAASAARQDPAAVWAGHAGVWHLSDPRFSLSAVDASSFGATADGSLGGFSFGETAVIKSGVAFTTGVLAVPDPTDGHLDFDASSSFSVGVWVHRSTSGSASSQFVLHKGGEGPSMPGYDLELFGSGSARACLGGAGVGELCASSAGGATGWTHLVGVVDRTTGLPGTLRLYRNGYLADITTLAPSMDSASADRLTFGGLRDGTSRLEGALDEVRIAPRALPAAWIAAEHANQSNPAAFYIVGPLELAPIAP